MANEFREEDMAYPAKARPERILSAKEYLLGENDNPRHPRHEFVNGLIYALTGASRCHNRIAIRLSARLERHMRGTSCETFQSDMKVKVHKDHDLRFYYPDVQVTCEHEEDPYYNEHPSLIVEILSAATERLDRTEKRLAYQSVPSVQEVVLLAQDFPRMELYRRRTDWQAEYFEGNQIVTLESIGFALAIEELYLP